jgi:heme/copper-type cytochrome/quinol oxidase subunit 3
VSSSPIPSPAKNQTTASLIVALTLGIVFLLVQIGLSRYAPFFEGHRIYSFFVLSCIGLASGCGGWALGLFLSPIGSQVTGAQKVLAGFAVFWSGVVVSHLQGLSELFENWQKSSLTSATKVEAVFGIGIFLFALCVTFNTRFDSPPTSPKESNANENKPRDNAADLG